jgi:hypothetical protein
MKRFPATVSEYWIFTFRSVYVFIQTTKPLYDAVTLPLCISHIYQLSPSLWSVWPNLSKMYFVKVLSNNKCILLAMYVWHWQCNDQKWANKSNSYIYRHRLQSTNSTTYTIQRGNSASILATIHPTSKTAPMMMFIFNHYFISLLKIIITRKLPCTYIIKQKSRDYWRLHI